MYQKKVTLIGFLGRNAEVRSDGNFTTLSLATKSSCKKTAGIPRTRSGTVA
jgi:single-strand DNA-binding protein